MRFVLFVFLTGILAASCIKEESVELGGNPPGTVDTLDPAPADTCRLIRIEQGGDSLFTLYYDLLGRLHKINTYDAPSNFSYDISAYINSSNLVEYVGDNSPMPLSVFYDYSSPTRVSRMLLIDSIRQSDSTIYTFEYGSGSKPIRRNMYAYSSLTTGGLFEYYLFDYDSKGNISSKQTFWASGQLQETVVFTYLDQPNSFKSLAFFSDPFNFFDMRNAIDVEACWNTNDAATAVFTNSNGEIIRRKQLSYEKDSRGRVVKVRSDVYYNTPGDGMILNYELFYNCP